MYKKKNGGFTLIELLAVIIILGVVVTIAIPNIISTLDKNKRDSFIKDARRAVTSAEYTIRSETKYEYPDNNTAVVFPFSEIKNLDLEISPFDTYYSLEDSFVAITKEPVGSDYEYVYYIHIVSCTDENCDNLADNSVAQNRGINVARAEDLNNSGRYELVVKGDEVITDYLENSSGGSYEGIKSAINAIRSKKGISSIANVIVY